DVARLQACVRRARAGLHLGDLGGRRARVDRDAEVRVGRLAGRDQLRGDLVDRRRGDREADAGVVARLALDLRVDADHAALRVKQRGAGVAVVDSRVGLDRVADRELRLAGDRPVERAHDAARDRLLEAERAADGDDAVADLQVARAAYREREELRGGRVDLDNGA